MARRAAVEQMTPQTLKKYGMTWDEYMAFVSFQRMACPLCKKDLGEHVVVDHEHVPKWKKMKPEQRKKYVRGLVHRYCNKFLLGRAVTLEKACNVADYLLAYEKRKECSTQ